MAVTEARAELARLQNGGIKPEDKDINWAPAYPQRCEEETKRKREGGRKNPPTP